MSKCKDKTFCACYPKICRYLVTHGSTGGTPPQYPNPDALATAVLEIFDNLEQVLETNFDAPDPNLVLMAMENFSALQIPNAVIALSQGIPVAISTFDTSVGIQSMDILNRTYQLRGNALRQLGNTNAAVEVELITGILSQATNHLRGG